MRPSREQTLLINFEVICPALEKQEYDPCIRLIICSMLPVLTPIVYTVTIATEITQNSFPDVFV